MVNYWYLVMVADTWLFSKPELNAFLDLTNAFDATPFVDWSFKLLSSVRN